MEYKEEAEQSRHLYGAKALLYHSGDRRNCGRTGKSEEDRKQPEGHDGFRKDKIQEYPYGPGAEFEPRDHLGAERPVMAPLNTEPSMVLIP